MKELGKARVLMQVKKTAADHLSSLLANFIDFFFFKQHYIESTMVNINISPNGMKITSGIRYQIQK